MSKLTGDKDDISNPRVLKWKTSVILIVCLKEAIP